MLKTVSSITNAIGALNYIGTWNASTNTPALASGVGTKGSAYVVSVAGTTTVDGISNWGVGDTITFNGTTWVRIEGGADGNFVNATATGTMTAAIHTSSRFTQTVASATPTTVLDISGRKTQGLIFVMEVGGTRIGACGRFANYYSGSDTPILDIVSNSGVSGSALTLSGSNIQFTHTFGSNRTVQVSVVYFNS